MRRTQPSMWLQHAPWLSLLVVFACVAPADQPADTTAAPDAAVPTPSDQLLLASAKVALPPEGLRLEDLPDPESGGAKGVQAYCTACHAMPTPTMHSAIDWPAVVRRMWLRMDLLEPPFQVPVPQLGERIVMLDYLTANALRVNRAMLPEAPGREAFQLECAQCHDLPDPTQHSPDDWYVVVRRMNQHMRDILGRELTSAQVDSISQYLGHVTDR